MSQTWPEVTHLGKGGARKEIQAVQASSPHSTPPVSSSSQEPMSECPGWSLWAAPRAAEVEVLLARG
jgi:hypothetical protein